MKSSSVYESSSVVPSRASSYLDSDEQSPSGSGVSRKLPLDLTQSKSLLRFLVEHALFLLDDGPSNGPMSSKLLDPFVLPLFNSAPDNVVARRLVTWVEVLDAHPSSLDEERPRRFAFAICKQMIIRRPKKGEERFSYERRTFMRVEFLHSFSGRSQKPTLDLRCDLASFLQNPAARYALSQGVESESDLRFLLEFLLFPLRELQRVCLGNAQPYLWFVRSKKHERVLELNLQEHLFKKVKSPVHLFPPKALELDINLDSSYLSKLQVDSVSFSMQPSVSVSALTALVGGQPLTREQSADLGAAINSRLVALQSAIFNSRKFFGAYSSGFSNIRVDTQFKEMSTKWKDASDDFLRSKAASVSNQKVAATNIRVFRPIYNHALYSISFRTFDAASIRKQFQSYGEYEHTRIRHASQSGMNLPSSDKMASILQRSVEVSVTVHGRVLSNDMKIRSASDLRDVVLRSYEGSVEKFSQRVFQQAFEDSGVYYWNTSFKWSKFSEASKSQFKEAIDTFCSKRKAAPHFEEISPGDWKFMSKLSQALADGDSSTYESLRQLFVLKDMYLNKNKIKRIAGVPPLALSCLILWYMYPSENIVDILGESDIVPDEWKEALNNPHRSGLRQAAMRRLVRECTNFLLENFGVDVTYPRDLHREVYRKSVEVLSGVRMKEKSGKDFALPEESSLRMAASYPTFFFNELRTGGLFSLSGS